MIPSIHVTFEPQVSHTIEGCVCICEMFHCPRNILIQIYDKPNGDIK